MTDKNEPNAVLAYEVQYQTTASRPGEWFVMSGRDHNQPYRHPGYSALSSETSDMLEADDTANALVERRAFPHDPKSRYYVRVVAAQVVTRMYFGQVTAVYGTPVTEEDTGK